MGPEERFGRLARRTAALGGDPATTFGVHVPLRVCPLGAHVDHQGGVVTGLTVDRGVTLVAAPVDEPRVRLESLEFPGAVEVRLDREPPPRDGGWGDYVRGAVAALAAEHRLWRGFVGTLSGDLPGTGLSSSAAVLLAELHALAEVNGIAIEPRRAAELVRAAENGYIGLSSGLLDPSVMVWAQPGHLVRFDCSDLAVDRVPAPAGATRFRVLAAFSGVARKLVATGFNTRVEECREAARALLGPADAGSPAAPRLRDVPAELFASRGHRLEPRLRRRATHYFGEQRRVEEGVEAWKSGDLARFGALVTASGESSIVNYETGTPPMVALFRLLVGAEGVYGARFSGGGFGGSCIALVEPGAVGQVIERTARGYAAAFPEFAGAAGWHDCGTSGAISMLDGAGRPWTR